MPSLRFTKSAVSTIPHPKSGQKIYRDTQLRGFGLRVGTNSKVYIAEGQVNGRTRRVSIGRADVLHPDVARKIALGNLGEMVLGHNPNEVKRRKAQQQISVEQAFVAFFSARPNLSPHTVESYRRTARLYLKPWLGKPMAGISGQMILALHQQVAQENGEVTANNVMRHLRSVYNFTAATRDGFPQNPVEIISRARAWFRERRRRGVIAAHDMPAWFAAVMQETPDARDVLLVALFTGMRRSEVLTLRWENVDLVGRVVTVPRTKNGEALVLPLSSFLAKLIAARRKQVGQTPWVFPGVGRRGHLAEVKSFVRRVSQVSEVAFSMHDLRRTFVTVAESLDISYYALKRLLNHRIGGDITSRYIVLDTERLRQPVERVAKRILELANQSE